MKKIFNNLMSVLAMFSMALIPAHTLSAASIYDTNYRHTNSLALHVSGYGVTCSSEDITQSWASILRDPNSWPSNFSSPVKTAAIASFNEAAKNGYYGATQNDYSSGTITAKSVSVYWTEQRTTSLEFYNPANQEEQVILPSNGTDDIHQVEIQFSQWARGYGGCSPIVHVYGHGHTTGSYAVVSGSLYEANYFTNAPISYPSGYEGQYVPYREITGTVNCADGDISNVLIEADTGIDGDAKLSSYILGGVQYGYYLTEGSDYRLVVMCEGEPYYSPTVDVDHYDNHDWVCVKQGDSGVCSAS